jgi:hypothetical protein
LNFPGLRASTEFVPNSFPAATSMSATLSNMNFYRCGGNGGSQAYGAVMIGAEYVNVNGITLNNINIYNPQYQGIDIRLVLSGLVRHSRGLNLR